MGNRITGDIMNDTQTKKTITIKVSDFTKTPKGREIKLEGKPPRKHTGEEFRETYLTPIFNDYDEIIVDLDNIYGCPSSFREESFGGLARIYGSDEVLAKLKFICTDQPPLIDMIKDDIKKANEKK